MDLYLLDGPKALYRLALAAMRMYHKSNMFNTARTGSIYRPILFCTTLQNIIPDAGAGDIKLISIDIILVLFPR